MLDLQSLNEPQRQAVLTTEGPLLVLAGAGSGKTRVLTYRIAHMIEDLQVAPWQILAITFTNKAAKEMRDRLITLIGPAARGMWVSTFHAMCGRVLRANAELVHRTPDFTIYDTDDMKRLMKALMADLDINPKIYQPNALMNAISTAKNDLLMPADFEAVAVDPLRKAAAKVYRLMEERLEKANAFDFDDMLLYTAKLLKDNPQVLEAYQDRFKYILVDEYQDTNKAQYVITSLLAQRNRNLMVVGDDDQSIYSWRGADIRNILDFEQDYKEATVIKLEQNYRSSANILAAANAVIANNQTRKDKTLFTEAPDGEKINVYLATDERDEGRWIAGEIEKRRSAGATYDDVAVFYRTNAQSRMLEDMLLRAGVPYRIVGGVKFFERQEIHDVMAYLTLVVNSADDMAAKRVINTPRRGIGDTSITQIDGLRSAAAPTFIDACRIAAVSDEFRPAIRRALTEFLSVIDESRSFEGDLRPLVEMIIEKSGLVKALEQENTDEARGRIENIKELLGVVNEFVESHADEDTPFDAPTAADAGMVGDNLFGSAEPQRTPMGKSLADFVEWVALRTDLDSMEEGAEAVTLMTVHAAKGLEFPIVFVAGMEESLFPHGNVWGDAAALEEERRLAYVAITRARKVLYMSFAQARQIYGETQSNPVSRFITEIPQELRISQGVGSAGYMGVGWEKRGSRRGISGSGAEAGGGGTFHRSSAGGGTGSYSGRYGDTNRYGSGSGRSTGYSSPFGTGSTGPATSTSAGTTPPPAPKKAGAGTTFAVGDRVDHKVFGPGVVREVKGDTVTVKFTRTGATKTLLKDYAPIVKVTE